MAGSPVAAQGRGPRTNVEGIAAWIGGGGGSTAEPILLSDVELNARLSLAAEAPVLTARIPPPLMRASLEELIGSVLIAREAERLRVAEPSASDVARERARIAERIGGVDRLGALMRLGGVSDAEIDTFARRRAYVDAFLRANLEGSTVISDAQVASVYERDEHPFRGRPLEEVREVLRAWIAQQTLQRDVQRWIEALMARASIRRLGRFATPAPAPAEPDAPAG
ncbi:MAG: hypothetical protein AB7S26_13890 [Sandaracinaceae bacterium]